MYFAPTRGRIAEKGGSSSLRKRNASSGICTGCVVLAKEAILQLYQCRVVAGNSSSKAGAGNKGRRELAYEPF